MKQYAIVLAMVGTLAGGFFAAHVAAQAGDTVDAHVAAAKALNAKSPTQLVTLCDPPPPARGSGNPPARGAGQPARGTPAPPDRSQWGTEPVKVFDNLYYVGE